MREFIRSEIEDSINAGDDDHQNEPDLDDHELFDDYDEDGNLLRAPATKDGSDVDWEAAHRAAEERWDEGEGEEEEAWVGEQETEEQAMEEGEDYVTTDGQQDWEGDGGAVVAAEEQWDEGEGEEEEEKGDTGALEADGGEGPAPFFARSGSSFDAGQWLDADGHWHSNIESPAPEVVPEDAAWDEEAWGADDDDDNEAWKAQAILEENDEFFQDPEKAPRRRRKAPIMMKIGKRIGRTILIRIRLLRLLGRRMSPRPLRMQELGRRIMRDLATHPSGLSGQTPK
ncbi:NaCP60E [Symbiodinium microadriaticum]|nr:NaCP60E [Symbiodinium microadriaticum]CAE7928424.1 NaCP60E [Symbiodinium sp. KB8]